MWDLNVSALLTGGGPELYYQVSGYPAAVLHLDALRLGPFADLGAIDAIGPCPAPAPGRPPRTASGPPRRPHVARQRIPQRLGMLGVQVDLVIGAVQTEADSSFSLTAIKVIDEQGLYLLSHGRPGPLTGLQRISVCSLAGREHSPGRVPIEAVLVRTGLSGRPLTSMARDM